MLKLKGLGTLKTYVNKPDKPGLNTARALLTSVGMSTSVAKSSVKVPTHATALEVMTKARSASALGPADQGATRGVDRLNAILQRQIEAQNKRKRINSDIRRNVKSLEEKERKKKLKAKEEAK